MYGYFSNMMNNQHADNVTNIGGLTLSYSLGHSR